MTEFIGSTTVGYFRDQTKINEFSPYEIGQLVFGVVAEDFSLSLVAVSKNWSIVVYRCCTMSNTIFSQNTVYKLVAEVCSSIYNQHMWSFEPGEYVTMKEFCYHSGIISSGRYSLHPFGNIVNSQENV